MGRSGAGPKPTEPRRSAGIDDLLKTHLIDDEMRANLKDLITRFGFAVLGGCSCLREDQIIVSHTVGLSERGEAEIVIAGFPQEQAMIILNQVVEVLPKTIPPQIDAILVLGFGDGTHKGMLRRLPTEEASKRLLHNAVGYYGHNVGGMQLVLADSQRRFPWEFGCKASIIEMNNVMIDWVNAPPAGPPEMTVHLKS